ncbi:MAG: hypothetical protein IJJ77_02000 [Paludibacteraceae bacterium]|nr:hypothetical protein [Paludibacteraceae bacterium]
MIDVMRLIVETQCIASLRCVSDPFNQIHNNNPANGKKNRLTASNIQNRRHIREPIVPSTVEDVYSKDKSNMNGEAMSNMPVIVSTTVESASSQTQRIPTSRNIIATVKMTEKKTNKMALKRG